MLSNQKGASFEVTSSINSSNGSPYQNPDEVQSGVLRFASDQTGMAMGNFNLPYGLIMQTQTMFNDPECKEIINLISFQKDFRDCALTLRL